MAFMDRMRTVDTLPGFEPEIGRWLWVIQDVRRRTLAALADIDSEAVDRASPGGNTIGSLIYHLVAIEMSYVYEDILQLGWCDDLAPLLIHGVRGDEGRLMPVRGEPLSTHLERVSASRALTLAAFRGMSSAEFRRPRSVEDYEITPEWALHHLVQHEAEHRGQIMEMLAR